MKNREKLNPCHKLILPFWKLKRIWNSETDKNNKDPRKNGNKNPRNYKKKNESEFILIWSVLKGLK